MRSLFISTNLSGKQTNWSDKHQDPQPPSTTHGARRSSKILVSTYKTAWHHIQENNKLYIKNILQNSPGTETFTFIVTQFLISFN